MSSQPTNRKWSKRALFALLTVLVLGLSFLVLKFAWRAYVAKEWHLPMAIAGTGSLVNEYHVYYRKHGRWPEPGSVGGGRETIYIRSDYRNSQRSDVFSTGTGRYVRLWLDETGSITVSAPRELLSPATQPSQPSSN